MRPLCIAPPEGDKGEVNVTVVRGQTRMEKPDPEGARRRVEDLDARLKAAREKVEKPRQNDGPRYGVSHRQTGVAYRVLADMIAGLLVGGLLGYWLGRWMDWAPYALVIGLVTSYRSFVTRSPMKCSFSGGFCFFGLAIRISFLRPCRKL